MLTKKEVRSDCRRLAKCGMRSYQWCLDFRDTCDECMDCVLIRRFYRKNVKWVDGKEYRRCSVCGQFYPVSMFYPVTIFSHGRVYHTYKSDCRLCRSEKYRKKKMAAMAAQL